MESMEIHGFYECPPKYMDPIKMNGNQQNPWKSIEIHRFRTGEETEDEEDK